MGLSVVILAAGQGTRMRSTIPKVLHPIGGKPMVEHVVTTAKRLNAHRTIVIYGNGGDLVPKRLASLGVICVEQTERLGTGHAVAQALPHLPEDDDVLILYGDVPLIQLETLQRLTGADVNLLTADFADPTGLGRIVRNDQGHILAIVEHKDATEQQRATTEINSGILSTKVAFLAKWLPELSNENAQKEYYLTDIIAMAVQDGLTVSAVMGEPSEVQGINDRKELAKMERRLQCRQAEALMADGVSLMDPARFDVRGTVKAGQDIVIDVNVILDGDIELADNVTIGPNCVLKNVRVGSGATIQANSVLEDAVIGEDCKVGPFARIRPGTELKNGARVGNFVEIKNSTLGAGSKVDHLSYIGDTTIGKQVGIGAGTITCNYDGTNKHRTVIEDFAFIGSDTQLVAPVRVGSKAVIGAGSTITKDAPSGELTLSRSKQVSIEGWRRPVKQNEP